MAKPTSVPTWATDAGATSDPGATRKATGFITGKKAPAKWFNWLHNRAGQWLSYLDQLHNEPEFLNKTYAWTGGHTWLADVTFKNLVVNNLFSAKAANVDGSVSLKGDVMLASNSGEVRYADANGVITSRPRSVLLPLGYVTPNSSGDHIARFSSTLGELTFFTAGTVVLPIEVPRGAELMSLTVAVENTAAISASFGWTLRKKVADKIAPASSVVTTVASLPITPMTAESQAAPAVPMSAIVNNANEMYWLSISGDLNIKVHWAELFFMDPGPRNG